MCFGDFASKVFGGKSKLKSCSSCLINGRNINQLERPLQFPTLNACPSLALLCSMGFVGLTRREAQFASEAPKTWNEMNLTPQVLVAKTAAKRSAEAVDFLSNCPSRLHYFCPSRYHRRHRLTHRTKIRVVSQKCLKIPSATATTAATAMVLYYTLNLS